MNTLNVNTTDGAPRRNFFRVAGATVLGLAGLASAASRAQALTLEEASRQLGDGPDWPGKLTGQHRQVVDAYEANSGLPLAFADNFLLPYRVAGAATAVVVLRHGAFPIALNNAMWAKYKLGESMKIDDPETKAPAVKNPFLNPKPGVLPLDSMALDRLLATGVLFGACNVALVGQSKKFANNAGVTEDEAAKEWAANLVPGITLLPSGVWGVNRAQEAGCTYCAGG